MTATTHGQDILSKPYDGSLTESPCTVLDALSLTIERVNVNGGDEALGAEGIWVGRVRRICAAKLKHWGLSPLIDHAQLLLSELLTNALRHATGDEIVVRLVLGTDVLLLQVNDGSPGRPRVREAGPDDESGRGMLLVSAIAASWGVSADETTTWCVLPITAEERTPC
jgi:anti-sigma regulatory factor (Ser/Thr protein kinase)